MKIISPIGILRWAHLDVPDPYKNQGKYSATLQFKEGDPEYEEFARKLTEEAQRHGVTKLPLRPAKSKDKDSGNVSRVAGRMELVAKSKRRPVCVNAKMEPIANKDVGFGSEVRISFEYDPYEGFGGGMTARLNGVQAISLKNDDPGFDEVPESSESSTASSAF